MPTFETQLDQQTLTVETDREKIEEKDFYGCTSVRYSKPTYALVSAPTDVNLWENKEMIGKIVAGILTLNNLYGCSDITVKVEPVSGETNKISVWEKTNDTTKQAAVMLDPLDWGHYQITEELQRECEAARDEFIGMPSCPSPSP